MLHNQLGPGLGLGLGLEGNNKFECKRADIFYLVTFKVLPYNVLGMNYLTVIYG